MLETELDPIASLKDKIKNLTKDQAVKLAREVCSQLDGSADSFHGGVYPENIRLDEDGRAILGEKQDAPASNRTADQVEYLAPEYFWDSIGTAATDVYSIGLVLYAGCNGGYLPFQPKGGALTDKDRSAALRKRMKGETIGMPKKMAPALKTILRKALAYEPEKRYATAAELLSALNEMDAPQSAAQETAAAGVAAGVAAATAADAAADTQELSAAGTDVPTETAAEEALSTDDAASEEASPSEEAPVEEPTTPDEATDAVPGSEEATAEDTADTEAAPAEDSPEQEQASDDTTTMEDSTAEEAAAAEQTSSEESAEESTTKYRVQKDFEQQGRSSKKAASVPYGGRTRKRTSPAITIASVVAAAVIVTVILVVVFGGNGSQQQTSQLYTTDTAETAASPTPLIITPAPNNLTEEDAEETSTPVPTTEATPASTADPEADGDEESDGDDDNSLSEGNTSDTSTSGSGSSGSESSGSGSSSSSSSNGSSSSNSGSSSSSGSSNSGSSSSNSSSSSSSSSSYTVIEANDTVYVQTTDVNVRTGPSTEYRVIGSVSTGDELQRTGTSGSWSRVTYNGETAFVFSSYLSTTAPTTTPEATATPAATAAATATPAATAAATATPSPTATATPTASAYTVTLKAQTLKEAKEALDDSEELAVITSEDDFDDITEALNATDAAYAWLGAEKDEEGQWYWVSGEDKTAFTDKDNTHWANENADDGDCFLLIKQSNGEWKYSSVSAADFDPTSDTYTGKLATVTQAADPDPV